jgi:VCBS repeat-containing protein
VARDDGGTIEEGEFLDLDLLANDSDADGDELRTLVLSAPADGVLQPLGSGRYRYIPDADFSGTDSFTYRVSDGQRGSNIATVTIRVLPTNDAPVAVDDFVDAVEDTAITFDVRANDTDGDRDPLSIASAVSPTNGSLLLNANGSFTYTPDADFFGTDTFTYVVSDGREDSNPATVTIRVAPRNDAPVAVADTRSTAEDTAITFDPRGNDRDADGDRCRSSASRHP